MSQDQKAKVFELKPSPKFLEIEYENLDPFSLMKIPDFE